MLTAIKYIQEALCLYYSRCKLFYIFRICLRVAFSGVPLGIFVIVIVFLAQIGEFCYWDILGNRTSDPSNREPLCHSEKPFPKIIAV